MTETTPIKPQLLTDGQLRTIRRQYESGVWPRNLFPAERAVALLLGHIAAQPLGVVAEASSPSREP